MGDYDLTIDSSSHTEKKSGKITSDASGSSFGSIAYKIPANYKGNTIREVDPDYHKRSGAALVENGYYTLPIQGIFIIFHLWDKNKILTNKTIRSLNESNQ
jgi:hypothetical protein